jgi:hypothetical protein
MLPGPVSSPWGHQISETDREIRRIEKSFSPTIDRLPDLTADGEPAGAAPAAAREGLHRQQGPVGPAA